MAGNGFSPVSHLQCCALSPAVVLYLQRNRGTGRGGRQGTNELSHVRRTGPGAEHSLHASCYLLFVISPTCITVGSARRAPNAAAEQGHSETVAAL